jgi:SAM-dependent methyltransferase
MTKDILGKALLDYHKKRFKKPLLLHNDYGKPETQPLQVFFQTSKSMHELDLFALSLCRGKVLDVGAGSGRHSLELQNKGLNVTSLDNSPCCVRLMKERGLTKVVKGNIYDFEGETFDTLLLMMNGIGLCQTLDNLCPLLEKFKSLLKPNGQVIFDSSDISYLYLDDPFPNDRYFGEIKYRYEYKGELGEWFKWLYIDKDTMQFKASGSGFNCQIIYQNDKDQYLARMTLSVSGG